MLLMVKEMTESITIIYPHRNNNNDTAQYDVKKYFECYNSDSCEKIGNFLPKR